MFLNPGWLLEVKQIYGLFLWVNTKRESDLSLSLSGLND
jgi:hypothetical protein